MTEHTHDEEAVQAAAMVALVNDPGVAKALREYRRADDYGKITSDYAALVVARKVAAYAQHTEAGVPEGQIDQSMFAAPKLPTDIIRPLLDFLIAEKARNEVINEGKLVMFSDRRKGVWDEMRHAAHALADALHP